MTRFARWRRHCVPSAPGPRASRWSNCSSRFALTGLGLGALALMSTGVLAAFDADPAAAEQQQRGRATMAAIVEDAARAGMSFVDDAAGGPGRDVPSAVPDGWRHGAWTRERAPVDARGDGRCPHCRACAVAGRGAGGRNAAGARPSGLLQPGVADLPLRRRRRRAARRARWRLRAGRGARGVAAAGHRPRRAAGAGLAGRHPGLGGRGAVPTRCAPTPRPGWTRSSAARARARRCRSWTSCRSFEVEWLVAGAAPAVRLAPDAHRRARHLWAAAARGGRRRGPRLARRRELRLRPRRRRRQRLPAGARSAAAPCAVPLSRFVDGPWCPSPAAPTRWDADLARVVGVRVRVEVAVASALLRPPFGAVMGRRRPGAASCRRSRSAPRPRSGGRRGRRERPAVGARCAGARVRAWSSCSSGWRCWPAWRSARRWSRCTSRPAARPPTSGSGCAGPPNPR